MRYLSIFVLFCALAIGSCGDNTPGGQEDPETPKGGVVLGSVTWATSNVGAPGTFVENDSDFGLYYQFDRRTGWTLFGESSDGSIWDGAAYTPVQWSPANDPCPNGWRLPTNDDFLLLTGSGITGAWDETKSGYVFTDDSTGASIFLPAAGGMSPSGTPFDNLGLYWSTTLDDTTRGFSLMFDAKDCYPSNGSNYACAFSVRCVLVK
jgi:uncharacterized protein (TIGR02145 family)